MSTDMQDTQTTSVHDAAAKARADRALLVERLHRAAAFIDEQPELTPYQVQCWGDSVVIHDFTVSSPDDLARVARAIGGRWEKHDNELQFTLAREVAEGVKVELVTGREAVCERVVVGTETVEVPDPEAPTVTVERDVVEWRCAPILADREPQTA